MDGELCLRHTLQLAFTNIKRIARLQTPIIGILVIGYTITILCALIVFGIVEGERVASWEQHGGDLQDLYTIDFTASGSASSGIDYHHAAEILGVRSDITQIFAYVRQLSDNSVVETTTMSLAGFSYARSPGWPPLEWGRYFSQYELTEADRVAIAGPYVPGILKDEIEYVEAFGERWRLIGRMARTSPRTGQSLSALDDVLIVPLLAFVRITSGRTVNALFNVFIPNHLSNEAHEELLRSLQQAAPGYLVSLRRLMEKRGAIEVWQNRLIALGITIGIIGFAFLNLIALIRYWVRRRSYEVAVRLCSGASQHGVSNMLFGEQLILVSIAYIIGVALFLVAQSAISHTGLIVAASSVQIALVAVIAYGVAITATKLTMWEMRRTDVIKLLRGAVI